MHPSSRRVHSYYTRSPRDLPVSGYAVQVVLRVRRFRCVKPAFPKRTFAGVLPNLLKPNARRTVRLEGTLRQIGLALGGEPGARLLPHLGMASSADTLLRIVRRLPEEASHTPRVLGVDDWALRQGHACGTILVDLEHHRTADLLPSRSAETLARWLRDHPGVEVMTRDRSKEYARGAADGAPFALQVADRWHLLHNLRQVAERLISYHHVSLNELPPAQRSEPLQDVPTQRGNFPRTRGDTMASEASRARRFALYERIQRLRHEGLSIRQIASAHCAYNR